MTDRDIYKCRKCGFEWFSPQKKYDKCPDCGSNDITQIKSSGNVQILEPVNPVRTGTGRGVRSGPPRACKCGNCGYETTKTQGVPCRNSNCPECGSALCGAD